MDQLTAFILILIQSLSIYIGSLIARRNKKELKGVGKRILSSSRKFLIILISFASLFILIAEDYYLLIILPILPLIIYFRAIKIRAVKSKLEVVGGALIFLGSIFQEILKFNILLLLAYNLLSGSKFFLEGKRAEKYVLIFLLTSLLCLPLSYLKLDKFILIIGIFLAL